MKVFQVLLVSPVCDDLDYLSSEQLKFFGL